MSVELISILDCGNGGSCNRVIWSPSPMPPPSKPHSLSLDASVGMSPTARLVTDRERFVEVYRKGFGPVQGVRVRLLLETLVKQQE